MSKYRKEILVNKINDVLEQLNKYFIQCLYLKEPGSNTLSGIMIGYQAKFELDSISTELKDLLSQLNQNDSVDQNIQPMMTKHCELHKRMAQIFSAPNSGPSATMTPVDADADVDNSHLKNISLQNTRPDPQTMMAHAVRAILHVVDVLCSLSFENTYEKKGETPLAMTLFGKRQWVERPMENLKETLDELSTVIKLLGEEVQGNRDSSGPQA